MQLQQPARLYFVYGWRRGNGPYYLDSASTIDEGIALARPFLKTHKRVTVETVHEDGAIVWDRSEPAQLTEA